MSGVVQRKADRRGRALAVFDGLHGEIDPAADAVAAGPDFLDGGVELGVDGDAATLEGGAGDRVEHLADGLEHAVGGQREALAGVLRAAVGT